MSSESTTPIGRTPSDATFQFTSHPSVQAFKQSPPEFLRRHFDVSNKARPPVPKFLATGAIVFDHRPPPNSDHPPRTLLIQRAAHDSMPLNWETPGGGCDDDDPSILHACARELKEEAGLDAVSVGPVVPCASSRITSMTDGNAEAGQAEWGERMGGQFFLTRRGGLVCKFYFIVELPEDSASRVNVDPNEHSAFVWATEDEVRRKKMDGENGIQLDFTTREQYEVILAAFKMWNSGKL
ncbi:NUDIX hydrolase domain-like protein [Naviculisporaceae sp. PSN 640]